MTALALVALSTLAACGTTGATAVGGTGVDPSGVRPTARPASGAIENPNHVDNNAWTQRLDPTPTDRVAAERLSKRVRPLLQRARDGGGDISPDAVKAMFVRLGASADSVQVAPLRPAFGDPTGTPPPGALFGVRVGDLGCVVGDVRRERVDVEVRGVAPEFGCLEPFNH